MLYLALPVKRSANQPKCVAILAVCEFPFHLPTVCTNKRSSLPLGTYSEVPLITSLLLDMVSIMCATHLLILTNNLYYNFDMVLTVQYYTWDWWVSGLSAFPHIYKRTQNFSQWICLSIQVTGTHSVVWTVQPNLSEPNQYVPPHHLPWWQQTGPVPKTLL